MVIDFWRLYMTREQIQDRTAPGVVQVYGEAVETPSRVELGEFASLDEVNSENAYEHEAGCHGRRCDGRCAERTYARWSAVADADGRL